MGSRMVAALESPVHQNWKDAIVGAAETRHGVPQPVLAAGAPCIAHRCWSERLEHEDHVAMDQFGTAMDLYFGGDMEASLALGGQVIGRIDEVKPVAQIIDETMREFAEVAKSMAALSATDLTSA